MIILSLHNPPKFEFPPVSPDVDTWAQIQIDSYQAGGPSSVKVPFKWIPSILTCAQGTIHRTFRGMPSEPRANWVKPAGLYFEPCSAEYVLISNFSRDPRGLK